MTTGANIHVLLLHNCGFHDLNVLTFRRLLFHIEGGEGRGGEGLGRGGGGGYFLEYAHLNVKLFVSLYKAKNSLTSSDI